MATPATENTELQSQNEALTMSPTISSSGCTNVEGIGAAGQTSVQKSTSKLNTQTPSTANTVRKATAYGVDKCKGNDSDDVEKVIIPEMSGTGSNLKGESSVSIETFLDVVDNVGPPQVRRIFGRFFPKRTERTHALFFKKLHLYNIRQHQARILALSRRSTLPEGNELHKTLRDY